MDNLNISKLEIFLDMFYFNYTLQGYGKAGQWAKAFSVMSYIQFLQDLEVTACNKYGDKLSLRSKPRTIEW